MKKLLSFIDNDEYLEEYRSKEELRSSILNLGLDGIELVRCDENEKIPLDIVYGVHLPFFTSWVDYYLGNSEEVIRELSSLELAREFYQKEPERLYEYYLKDLDFAEENAEYTVFHIGNTTSLEYLSQNHHYSDEEVIDASANLINEILSRRENENLFLLENLYFPGLQFNDIGKTKRLLERIEYKNLGFMLDTGHLMNTNPSIKNEDQGWDFIEEVLESHKELLGVFKGVHLHISVSGKNINKFKENPPILSSDFYERFKEIYDAVGYIDTHSIIQSKKASKVLEKLDLEYLVLEFKSENRWEREEKVKNQLKLLF